MPQMLAVQLDRVHRSVPWGIQLGGGRDADTPLRITEVDGETLATHHLSPGDEVLYVQGVDAMHLREADAREVLRRAGRTLELLVAKADRANTPVNVPEPIHLAATPDPDPRDHLEGLDHDDDGDDDDNEDDADDALLRKRVLDTYLRLREDRRRQSQDRQRVVREDSWWIQGADREENVRPTDRALVLGGWPLARRNSDGGGASDHGQPERVATLPRRTRSLRGRRPPAEATAGTTTSSSFTATAPASAPAAPACVSPFHLQFEQALDIIAQCRAQLGDAARTPRQTPDLIDLHTELDPKCVPEPELQGRGRLQCCRSPLPFI
ncbi:hypothetical protein ONE63_003282 [Megalurothrips usitatus]|uniref:PDZ domain-containing protein n=1 Tax=Megalurothrips usitatus TaxID=439358 RepID=A0AAV7X6V3_9NEOP|nr:hypothetical protein ONE63_003282 [Megalurothrips usitatus]